MDVSRSLKFEVHTKLKTARRRKPTHGQSKRVSGGVAAAADASSTGREREEKHWRSTSNIGGVGDEEIPGFGFSVARLWESLGLNALSFSFIKRNAKPPHQKRKFLPPVWIEKIRLVAGPRDQGTLFPGTQHRNLDSSLATNQPTQASV